MIDAETILTQGGATTHTSAQYDLDGKAACLISIDTDYSNHAKATAGLTIGILRDVDGTVDESVEAMSVEFEMPFVQSGTRRKTFFLSAQQFQKFKLYQSWGNTTGSSVATSATAIKYATIPLAS